MDPIGGPVLASATKTLPPQDLQGVVAWIHYELPTPVTVTPGQTYVIELQTTNATHSWDYGNDGYAGGRAIYQGIADAKFDNLFRTYAQEAASIKGDVDCSGEVNSVDALKILRHAAQLSVTQTDPCIDIGDPS